MIAHVLENIYTYEPQMPWPLSPLLGVFEAFSINQGGRGSSPEPTGKAGLTEDIVGAVQMN